MTVGGTLRVGASMWILQALPHRGVDPKAVFAAAGVPAELFSDPDNHIPAAALAQVATQCARMTNCPHFSIFAGDYSGLSSLGKIGFLVRHSPDVGTALRNLVTYFGYQDQGATVTLTVEARTASLSYAPFAFPGEGASQINDGALAIGMRIMRELCGTEWSPREVTFAHSAPADLAPYSAVFGPRMRFDAPQAALHFAEEWLSRPVSDTEPELMRLLQKDMEAARVSEPLNAPDMVRRILRQAIGKGPCSAEHVARLFGITERSLHRQLARHETGFQELLDTIRYDLARQYLASTSLPAGKIADLLAYSEASAFTRAFTRWAGVSPGDWRRANRERWIVS